MEDKEIYKIVAQSLPPPSEVNDDYIVKTFYIFEDIEETKLECLADTYFKKSKDISGWYEWKIIRYTPDREKIIE